MKQEDIETPHALHGNAISEIIFTDNGEIWISNGEYASQVNYCPMTGKKAGIQVTLEVLKNWNTDNFYKFNDDENTTEYFKEIREISKSFRQYCEENSL